MLRLGLPHEMMRPTSDVSQQASKSASVRAKRSHDRRYALGTYHKSLGGGLLLAL